MSYTYSSSTREVHDNLPARLDWIEDGVAAVANGGSLPVNVTDHGADPSKTPSFNSGAIQEAFDTAASEKRPVSFELATPGQFQIDAAIQIARMGQIIRGGSPWYTQIKQMTVGEHLFSVVADPDGGNGALAGGNQSIRFEHMQLIGRGTGVATAYGIDCSVDGDWMQLLDVVITGFERGIFTEGWAQVDLEDCILTSNNYGGYHSGATAANTIAYRNTATAKNGAVGAYFGSGGGITIIGGDHTGQPRCFEFAGTPSVASIMGGNFESSTGAGTGTEFIYVHGGSYVHSVGSQFQKVTGGVEMNAFKVDAGNSLVVDSPVFVGFASGTALVNYSGDCNVQVRGQAIDLATQHHTINQKGGTEFEWSQFPSRADNSVPAAAITNRGLVLQQMSRDSGGVDDALWWYMRQGGGTAAQYQKRLLSAVIQGAGSPEGVVYGRRGALYVRTDGAVGTTLYGKETGDNTNTGWTAYSPGSPGPAGPAGSRGEIKLAGAGLITENFDLALCAANTAPTQGTGYGSAVGLFSGDVVTNLCVCVVVAAAGTAPTMFKLGLADSTNKIVALTADISSSLTSTGVKQLAISGGAYTVPASGAYSIVIVQVGAYGTTQPTLARAGTLTANAVSGALAGKIARYATYGTGLTDLPAVNSSLAAAGQTTFAWWMGAS